MSREHFPNYLDLLENAISWLINRNQSSRYAISAKIPITNGQPINSQDRVMEGFMGKNAMLHALPRMGYDSRATEYGFRNMAITILNEHGASSAAYNHAEYLLERRRMMQWWANYLDKSAVKI